ncbi:alpha/beta fold hydrolase [Polynucleobacter paneuropaeus]|nr:alpha/beta fold hydrolase [Polynucleobacter paneuropaeus]
MLKSIPEDWPNRSFSRSIQTGDLTWHVQVAGTSPIHVLLLHGTGSSAHTWGNLFTALSKKYTVVAPDLPGHGFTKNLGQRNLNLDALADKLSELREALHIEYFDHIIGHSAGATLALSYTLKNKQAKTIVGLNPSLISLPSFYNKFVAPFLNPIVTSSFFTAVLSDLLPHTRMIDGLIDSTNTKLDADKRARYKTLFKNADHLNGSVSFMAGTDISSLLEQCNQIRSSLTFVLTEDDGWIPAQELRKVINQYFNQANIIEIKGGHMFHEANETLALQFIEEALSQEGESHVSTS